MECWCSLSPSSCLLPHCLCAFAYPHCIGHFFFTKFPMFNLDLLNLKLKWIFLFWQLGLVENNILNYEFELVASDPSDANTNSTTLFSDDTDDKSKRSTNPETVVSIQQEQEVNASKQYLNNKRKNVGDFTELEIDDFCHLEIKSII